MKTMKIQVEARYDEALGRTVLYDERSGTPLFVATEAAADLPIDLIEFAIQLVMHVPVMGVPVVEEETE